MSAPPPTHAHRRVYTLDSQLLIACRPCSKPSRYSPLLFHRIKQKSLSTRLYPSRALAHEKKKSGDSPDRNSLTRVKASDESHARSRRGLALKNSVRSHHNFNTRETQMKSKSLPTFKAARKVIGSAFCSWFSLAPSSTLSLASSASAHSAEKKRNST